MNQNSYSQYCSASDYQYAGDSSGQPYNGNGHGAEQQYNDNSYQCNAPGYQSSVYAQYNNGYQNNAGAQQANNQTSYDNGYSGYNGSQQAYSIFTSNEADGGYNFSGSHQAQQPPNPYQSDSTQQINGYNVSPTQQSNAGEASYQQNQMLGEQYSGSILTSNACPGCQWGGVHDHNCPPKPNNGHASWPSDAIYFNSSNQHYGPAFGQQPEPNTQTSSLTTAPSTTGTAPPTLDTTAASQAPPKPSSHKKKRDKWHIANAVTVTGSALVGAGAGVAALFSNIKLPNLSQ